MAQEVRLPDSKAILSKIRIPLLAITWIFGLVLGIVSAYQAGHSVFRLMRMAANSHASIVSLLVSGVLPFLLSAAAVFFSARHFLFLIGFVKAFCFGCCACATMLSFGSAGWLICLLLMFSDLCDLPALIWFWLRHLWDGAYLRFPDTVFCIGWSLLVGSVDFCLVTPFLVSLIEL